MFSIRNLYMFPLSIHVLYTCDMSYRKCETWNRWHTFMWQPVYSIYCKLPPNGHSQFFNIDSTSNWRRNLEVEKALKNIRIFRRLSKKFSTLFRRRFESTSKLPAGCIYVFIAIWTTLYHFPCHWNEPKMISMSEIVYFIIVLNSTKIANKLEMNATWYTLKVICDMYTNVE